MMDFIKANPHINIEEYKWKYTIPQIRLSSVDYTHIVHLDENASKLNDAITIEDEDDIDLMNDFGIPIFGKKK